MAVNDPATIARLLRTARTIAVIGLSSDPARPSYGVARSMQQFGFRIIPVNPHETHILGETAYPDLTAVPEAVDLVNIFPVQARCCPTCARRSPSARPPSGCN